MLARCVIAAILASLFVWVGAQHLRTTASRDAPPPAQVAAALDTPTVEAAATRPERGSASLSLDAPAPARDPLADVLRRVCTLLVRVPPALRAGAGSEVCR